MAFCSLFHNIQLVGGVQKSAEDCRRMSADESCLVLAVWLIFAACTLRPMGRQHMYLRGHALPHCATDRACSGADFYTLCRSHMHERSVLVTQSGPCDTWTHVGSGVQVQDSEAACLQRVGTKIATPTTGLRQWKHPVFFSRLGEG